MQQEKGTPHFSLLGLLVEQLKYTFRFQSLGSLAPQQWFFGKKKEKTYIQDLQQFSLNCAYVLVITFLLATF